MMESVDFEASRVKLLLVGLISQTVLPYNEDTAELKKDMIIPVSFEGVLFYDYSMKIKQIRITSLKKLSNKDIFLNGFLHRLHFYKFMQEQGIMEDDTIVRVDFVLIKNKEW